MSQFSKKTKKKKAHFLHVRKTGGSAIKAALHGNLATSDFLIEVHSHNFSLKDVPEGEFAFFFLRDPISKFISGFYSRQRKGLPLGHYEWNPLEEKMFRTFKTPGELASALADQSSPDHLLAVESMNSVSHFRYFTDWYLDLDYFRLRLGSILFIGFQESLNDDFRRLGEILKLSNSAILPQDDVKAHRNPKHLDKSLEGKAIQALCKWYKADYKFIELCRGLRPF